MLLYYIIYFIPFISFDLFTISYESKYNKALGMRVYDKDSILASNQQAFPLMNLLIGGIFIVGGLIGKFIEKVAMEKVAIERPRGVGAPAPDEEAPTTKANNILFMTLLSFGLAGSLANIAMFPLWATGLSASIISAVYALGYDNINDTVNNIVKEMRKKLTLSNFLLGTGTFISWYTLSQYQKEKNNLLNESNMFFEHNANVVSQAWRIYYPLLNADIDEYKPRKFLFDAIKENQKLKESLQQVVKNIQEKDQYNIDPNDYHRLKELADGLWKVSYYKKLKQKNLITIPSPEGFFTDFELFLWHKRDMLIDFNNKNENVLNKNKLGNFFENVDDYLVPINKFGSQSIHYGSSRDLNSLFASVIVPSPHNNNKIYSTPDKDGRSIYFDFGQNPTKPKLSEHDAGNQFVEKYDSVVSLNQGELESNDQ